ncbi:MAG: hypothetical protein HMLKMBBP_00234 [Planctomycetes bacterium]|nr:hypothetical protein [Planctomycetota bacterium]
MRAGPVALIVLCVAGAAAAAFFALGDGDGTGGGDDSAADGSAASGSRRTGTAGGSKRPRGRAKPVVEVPPPPQPKPLPEDADWDAALAHAAAGRHLEALETVRAKRLTDDPAWKDARRTGPLMEWETAALDRFEAQMMTLELAPLRDWLGRLASALLFPESRARMEALRRKLVEAGKIGIDDVLAGADAEARKKLEAHLKRFGGAPGTDPDAPVELVVGPSAAVVDRQLQSLRARNKDREIPVEPLPIDSRQARNDRRVEQLEKLRQRQAEAMLDPIAGGLAWLALHQNEDGSWSDAGVAARCKALGHEKTPCLDRTGMNANASFRLGATGLAVLAFLDFRDQDMARHFEPTLTLGVDWLRKQIREDGSFPQTSYEAAIAVMALGQAARASKSPGVMADAQRAHWWHAIKQSTDGGYRYRIGEQPSDLSVTGWYAQAYEAVRDAGGQTPTGHAENFAKYVKSCQVAGASDKFAYQAGRGEKRTLRGVGMLTLAVTDPEETAKQKDAWAESLAKEDKQDRVDMYAVYYDVRVELALRGNLSAKRRALLADLPRTLQCRELPSAGAFAKGSQIPAGKKEPATAWKEPGGLLDRGGTVVTTALGVLTMEHALYRR